MRQDEITAVVKQVVDLLAEKYVFPDVGHRAGAVLTAALASGRYPDGVAAPALAALVTEDLQSVNGDLHLRLLFSEEPLRDDHGDDAADLAAAAGWAARTGGGIERVERLDGNIGLITINPLLFPPTLAGEPIAAAMTLVAGSSALVLDVRGCRGGSPDTVALLCSYLFGPEPVHLNNIQSRAGDSTRQMWTLPYLGGPRYGPDRPVAVLTSATTFSGAEELAFDLQERQRATIVGEVTRGGAHPRDGFAVHPHLEVTIPVARSVSPISGTNWEGVGVRPDLAAPAEQALDRAVRHLRTLLGE
ncbi:S41 family peptidase [Actinoplanes teichomyceticus]|uniref:Peptidase S41-like protein n=1 Tax=Actinoplanes teichomyceticus TaxID=1867 RepID=A0A561VIU6_ACTTI|nr:S41 family peptidase [Actinoplanes teichomyceticus]TWG11529.1 peptidase S41-like protein [Actinoplanes teichomyceticus]GIF15975.1 interphotoreceptor retinoid-binding protein [Actinoplanes teichomyceticus]